MPADQPHATAALRLQFFDRAVKAVVERSYKFKQALMVLSTSAWTNTFFAEKEGVLTDPSSKTSMEGIPRGAPFPQASVEFEELSVQIIKFGMEDTIPWEDTLSNNVDVRNRTLIKIAERVANQVDEAIWAALGGNINILGNDPDGTAHTGRSKFTQSFAIGQEAGWDESGANVIDDLMKCKQLIGEKYYPTNKLQVWINERDHRSIVRYLTDKGAQFPSISVTTAKSGIISNLAGFDIVVSNSVTASNALVVVPQRIGTFKQLVPIKTTVIEDPYKTMTIRTVEEGITELHNPLAVVRIMGTQASGVLV